MTTNLQRTCNCNGCSYKTLTQAGNVDCPNKHLFNYTCAIQILNKGFCHLCKETDNRNITKWEYNKKHSDYISNTSRGLTFPPPKHKVLTAQTIIQHNLIPLKKQLLREGKETTITGSFHEDTDTTPLLYQDNPRTCSLCKISACCLALLVGSATTIGILYSKK